MASNIVLKTYAAGDNNQGSVTPQNDALIYQCAVPMNGLFSGGTVTLSSANVLHVAAGFGIIGGRFFEVLESDISVQLSASGDLLGRLYIHLDLSNADNPISIETYTGASLPALTGDPALNISNGSFDMELCIFNVNELTISNIVLTYPTITASNNQIRRATAYSVNDMVLCQSASDALIFICTTAGTTAIQEPSGYTTVTDGNTVTDGTAVFTAYSVANLIDNAGGVLTVTVPSFNSLPQTVSNADITSDMVVVNSVLGTPSSQTGDWTVTTSTGSLTIAGTISGSTTLTLYLAKSN